MNPVYNIFNDIAGSMLRTEGGEDFISNSLKIQGAGNTHELSINQLQLFLGVVAGTHPFLSDYNPLEFLIFSYQFQDKIKKDWLAVQYQIIYDFEDDSIFISGICKHPSTVEGHSEYIPGAFIPAEQFQEHIPDVGLYGSLALVNCIAAQNEQFAPIRGSFGGSFIYEFKNGSQSIRKYEPTPLEKLGIEEDELNSAIEEAKKSISLDMGTMNLNGLMDAKMQAGLLDPGTAMSGVYETFSPPASGV
uniref:Uncharacterized protein n=1 Tax=Pseudomonas phage RVTF4 TaxID=3236931 RepID=A0AB39CCN2_9VIRU